VRPSHVLASCGCTPAVQKSRTPGCISLDLRTISSALSLPVTDVPVTKMRETPATAQRASWLARFSGLTFTRLVPMSTSSQTLPAESRIAHWRNDRSRLVGAVGAGGPRPRLGPQLPQLRWPLGSWRALVYVRAPHASFASLKVRALKVECASKMAASVPLRRTWQRAAVLLSRGRLTKIAGWRTKRASLQLTCPSAVRL